GSGFSFCHHPISRFFYHLISRKTAQIASNEQKILTFCSLLAILQTILREKPIFFANAYDFLAKKLGNLNNF
ncbi:MAG: hypothetical protein WAU22_04840, partial [Segatella copri]